MTDALWFGLIYTVVVGVIVMSAIEWYYNKKWRRK